MPTRFAVKRLTASDLTFFEVQFRKRNVGNQKAINLNAEVFVDQLYQKLPDYAAEVAGRIPVDLSIYGPGGAPLHNLQRKIRKGGTYKNWRLDGEFVHNPDEAPERYNSLQPGDVAVMAFVGDVTKPDAATLVLLSRNSQVDASLVRTFDALLGAEGSMLALNAGQLQGLVESARPNDGHPILSLVTDVTTEEVLGSEGRRRVGVRRRRRKQSREEFERGKHLREALGHRGEEFVNAYLRGNAAIKDVRWLEDDEDDATAPYDFQYTSDAGECVRVDVKTSTSFDNAFYLSEAELEEMQDENCRHEIYRIFGIDERSGIAELRIADNVRKLAVYVLALKLPDGVAILGIAVNPASVDFAKATTVSLPPAE